MKPFVILAGFADDLKAVTDSLSCHQDVCLKLDENTPDGYIIPQAKIIVYIFSQDTGYSSHLLSWFTWIHSNPGNAIEYTMQMGELGVVKNVFDFAKKLPKITIADLEKHIDKARLE